MFKNKYLNTWVSVNKAGLGKFEYAAAVDDEPCDIGEAGSSCTSKLSYWNT